MGTKRKSTEDGKILKMTKDHQYQTVEELFQKSEPNSVFYTLVIVSTIILTCGLLLNNDAIVIGGMLITPVLTPVLLISLGLAVGEPKTVTQALYVMGKSFVLIIGVGLLLTFIFGEPNEQYVFENTFRNAVLYFVVAVFAGVAGTFAWARKEFSDVLPGIAIAVSLVPPLSLIGISLILLDVEAARFYFLISVFNLLGIIVGSLIVFSLLKFYRVEKKVEIEAEESEREQKIKKKKKDQKNSKA